MIIKENKLLLNENFVLLNLKNMFGLIKYKMFSKFGIQDFRKCYCGTCKTIGRIYGHKERLTLNTDVVFLSNILLSMNFNDANFDPIEIKKCFKLPQNDRIPEILKYCSSINILLLYLKIVDNIQDSKFKINIWVFLKWLESSKFKKAKELLLSYGLNVDWIEDSINQQFMREKDEILIGNFSETYKFYSEITGKITGRVFEQGANLISKTIFSTNLYEIGKSFGELVYLIDAIDDYVRDQKMNRFNIFKFDFNDTINESNLQEVIHYIKTNIEKILSQIKLLPIPDSKKQSFTNILNYSFNRYTNCNCRKSKKKSDSKNMPVKKKMRLALSEAHRVTDFRKSKIIKHIAFAYVAVILILIFIFFPNSVNANVIEPNVSSDCCANCGGACDTCCFCGDEDCKRCGCCREIGSTCDTSGEGNSCGNCCSLCCTVMCIINCISCGDSDSGPKFIFIDKDNGGCCN